MKPDMSPAAVTARLRLTSELRRLCLALGKAIPIDEHEVSKNQREETRVHSTTGSRAGQQIQENACIPDSTGSNGARSQ